MHKSIEALRFLLNPHTHKGMWISHSHKIFQLSVIQQT